MWLVLGLMLLASATRADYECLCNNNVKTSIFAKPSTNSGVVGYMHRYSCKQIVHTIDNTDSKWRPIAHEHSVGYVVMDGSLRNGTCQGNPPYADKLTTGQPTSSTSAPSTIPPPTTTPTPVPTTTVRPTSTTTMAKTTKPTTTTKAATTSSPTPPTTSTTMKQTTTQPTTTPTTTQSTTTSTTMKPTTTSTTMKPTTTSTMMKPTTTQPTTTSTTTQPTTTSTTTRSPTTSTTTSPMTTTTTPQPTTRSTTTPKPTTTKPVTTTTSKPASHGVISGHVDRCPVSRRTDASRNGGLVTQYGNSCYELVPQRHRWHNAESYCQQTGGHLFHISSAAEETFIVNFLKQHNFNHSVWTGLHDLKTEEHFEWISGDSVTYTNWVPNRKSNFYDHSSEDCVVLVPYVNNGQWDDIPCGVTHVYFGGLRQETQPHYYICQQGVINNPLPQPGPAIGNVNQCPSHVISKASKYHYALAHYGSSCYMLVPTKDKWSHAEQYCVEGGGHLFHISNAAEQTFVEDFLNHHGFSGHSVWMGLHDRGHEENFVWTSGAPVNYTHWVPNRKHNSILGHSNTDCVVFEPFLNGEWDDIHCGFDLGHIVGGNLYAWVCQFDLNTHLPQPVIVGK